MNSIKSITAKFVDGQIFSEILLSEESENAEFAFYLFKNQERIQTTWYSKNPTCFFDTNNAPGYYHVVGFARISGENIGLMKSNPVFANPIQVTLDTLPDIDQQMVTYQLNGPTWSFPALYYPNNSDSLIVMLPSAINRETMTLPVFSRWTWASKDILPGNVLCIADPTLDLNDKLCIGWLLGDKDSYAITELAEFIIKLAKSKNIANEKIIIYGSSAGGFAALALAAHIMGSTAVAINAQTDVLLYENQNQVKLVQEHCFDGLSFKEIRNNFSRQINMSKLWKRNKRSKFFIIQNITDTHHYNMHFMPFYKASGGKDLSIGIKSIGNHKAWIYEHEGGHMAETIDMTKIIFETLALS